MSRSNTFGISFAEKIVGITLIIIGVLVSYYTYTNQLSIGMATTYFIVVGIILVLIGVILLVAKTD